MEETPFLKLVGNQSRMRELTNILESRETKCHIYGHKKPDEKKNFCNFCYQPLEYKTPEADAEIQGILKSREGLPDMEQPLDSSALEDIRLSEIRFQSDSYHFSGLVKLDEELKKF